MQRIDGPTAAAALPAPAAVSGTPGYFTAGNPAIPIPPTQVTMDWLNMTQEELVYVILEAGLALSKNDHTQLYQAISALITNAVNGAKVPFASDADTVAGVLANEIVTPHGAAALVTARINALVNGAPGALDTLKELADAINDDQNFAATVTTALAARMLTSWSIGVSGGLLTGGGDGTASRTLSLLKAAAADIFAGTADDRVITPAGMMAGSGGNWQRGWRTLPGGDVEQWGTEQVTGSGSSVQSFEIAFPTAFANAGALMVGNSDPYGTNPVGTAGYHPLVVMFEPATPTGCNAWLDAIQGAQTFSNTHTVTWRARGR